MGFGRANAGLDQLARSLGLVRASNRAGFARLLGDLHGIAVNVEFGRRRTATLSCKLDAPLPPSLWVTREEHGPLHRSSATDIQLEDPVLDPLLHIECEQPAAAIRILRAPRVREGLAVFFENYRRAHLNGGRLWIANLDDASVDRVRVALDRMVDLAESVGEAARTEEARHAGAKAQLRGPAEPEAAPVDLSSPAGADAQGLGIVETIDPPPAPERSPYANFVQWVERAYARRTRNSILLLWLPALLLTPIPALGLLEAPSGHSDTAVTCTAALWILWGLALGISWWRNTCPSCRMHMDPEGNYNTLNARFHLFRNYISWNNYCPHCGVCLRASSSGFWPFIV